MKTVSKNQFDTLLENRINAIAKILTDQLKTTDNNPEHLTAELRAKASEFLSNAVANYEKSLDAILTRPTAAAIGEFSIGVKKREPGIRRPRKAKEGTIWDGPQAPDMRREQAAEPAASFPDPVEEAAAWEAPIARAVMPREEPAPAAAPVAKPTVSAGDITDDDIESLLGEVA